MSNQNKINQLRSEIEALERNIESYEDGIYRRSVALNKLKKGFFESDESFWERYDKLDRAHMKTDNEAEQEIDKCRNKIHSIQQQIQQLQNQNVYKDSI